MKRKRVGALLLSMLLTVSLLGGCGSGNEITEAMIPTVTDLQAEGEAQASVIGLAMNKSYVAELTRLDGDNTQMASVDEKEVPVVLKATSVDKDLKTQLGISNGLQVKNVKAGAFKDAGISEGFIIITVNERPMKTISDLQDAVKTASTSKNPVLFITGMWPSGKTDYKAVRIGE